MLRAEAGPLNQTRAIRRAALHVTFKVTPREGSVTEDYFSSRRARPHLRKSIKYIKKIKKVTI